MNTAAYVGAMGIENACTRPNRKHRYPTLIHKCEIKEQFYPPDEGDIDEGKPVITTEIEISEVVGGSWGANLILMCSGLREVLHGLPL